MATVSAVFQPALAKVQSWHLLDLERRALANVLEIEALGRSAVTLREKTTDDARSALQSSNSR